MIQSFTSSQRTSQMLAVEQQHGRTRFILLASKDKMTQARHQRSMGYNIVLWRMGSDSVALPATQTTEPGSLITTGTEQSGCALEIRGRDERSSTTEPQHETLLEQHQGPFVKSHEHNREMQANAGYTLNACAHAQHRHTKRTFPKGEGKRKGVG